MIQRISVLLTCCLLQFATAVLAQSASDTPTADGLLDSRRTVWYDRDANENQPTVSNWKYLENRRALVGSGCTVNKLVSAVGVGEWADSLGNITNEDLSDYATFPSVLKAGVTVNPIVSVRDKNNYYGEGTEAGFCVVASSGASVLTLDVVKAMSLVFYRDGVLGSTIPVQEGQNAGGVSLTLIKIPGSDEACICLTAKAREIFDEVCLQPSGGVNLDLGMALKIKYAFVGRVTQTLLTDNGVKAYGEKVGTTAPGAYIKSVSGENPVLLGIPFPVTDEEKKKLVDDDLNNYMSLTPLVGLAYMGGAKIECAPGGENDNGQEVFKAGSEVGFKYKNVAFLDLSLGSAVNIELFNRAGKNVQTETLSAGVLGLGVATGGDGTASILAKCDFSGARIAFYGGLKVDLGGTRVYYGFVKEAPDVAHHCDIRPTTNTNVCDSQTSFQLHSNPALSVSWTLLLQPEGANAKVTASGYVTGMNVSGEYTFRATAADGCHDDVTLVVDDNFGPDNTEHCGTDFVNLDQAVYGTYTLMNDQIPDGSGSLVSISNLEHAENLLDKDYGNYATYVGGLGVANNLAIAGVQRTDGLMFDGTADQQGAVNVGFVVESDNEVIDAKVLEFFQIRCYKDNKEVYRHVISESNAIGAGVGTSTKTQKVRFSIRVEPIDKDAKPIQFDQIVLWKSGVLDLGLSKLKLYYAFMEDSNSPCANALSCGAVVLSDTTGTSINANACQMAGAVKVAGVDDNLSCLVDGNLNTAMTIVNTVDVGGGSVIAVNMGHTLDFRHQLGIVVDQKTYALGASVGAWLTVETYYKDKPTGDKFTDWKVLGANVIGYGEKNLLLMQPKEMYDEIRLTIAGVVSALDVQKFYGIFLRGDIDNDGIPDCKDTESCKTTIKDIAITDVCKGGSITVSGTGTSETDYRVVMKEQGINDAFTTNTTGDFSRTYVMSVSGRYNLLVYDGSGNLLTSVPYTVHPNQTTWRKNAATADWNEWNNWTNGSPYCCTDVVIPSQAVRYPVLSVAESEVMRADLFCCNNIHFEPQAAVGAPQCLNYTKAWVEWALAPNRYYLLAPTLHDTYTGDAFVPASMKGVQTGDYFTMLDETSAPQNRFNPIIYQRLWNKTAPGKLLGDGTTGEQTTVAVTQTEWTNHFNHLKHLYGCGEGFSLWVDNDALPATQVFRFRFPKEHTAYNYYNNYDRTQLALQETDFDRSRAGRFVYEDDANTTPENYTYKGYVGGGENTQQRHVYKGSVPLTLHLSGEKAGTFFLVGNPFQSYINVARLLKGNASVIKGVKLYDGNTNNTAVLADGQLVGDAMRIGPGEAFFVETAEAQQSIDLVLNGDMLTDEVPEEGAAADALCLTLTSKHTGLEASAWIVTGTKGLKGSATLFDAGAKPQLALFAQSHDGEACDVTVFDGRALDLGIYAAQHDTLTLRFAAKGHTDLTNYALLDRLTGDVCALYQGMTLTLNTCGTDLGRYALVAAKTAVKCETVCHSHSLRVVGHDVQVRSDASDLCELQVFATDGRLVATSRAAHAQLLECRGVETGLYVLRVTDVKGKCAVYKVWVD